MKDILEEIFASLKSNKLRTFLTGFAISWGIFMLVALLACGNGLKNAMLSNFNYMSRNALSVYGGYTSKPYGGKKQWRKIDFSDNDIDFLKRSIKDIEYFSAVSDVNNGSLIYNNIENSIALSGVEPDYMYIRVYDMVSGRFINDIDNKENRKVVVIDNNFAEKLFQNPDSAIGKNVKLTNDLYFNVVGVYKTKGGNYQPEVFIPLNTAKTIYNPSGRVESVTFTLNEHSADIDYTKEIRAKLSKHLVFAPDDYNAVWINDFKTSYEQSKMIFGGLSMFIWFIGISTLIAGIVGVGNIMLITVKERTREFGIRKAIGATPGSIIRMVVAEAITITAVFGYIGMLLGMGLSEILCLIFPDNPPSAESGPAMFANPSVDISIVISATIVLIVAGVIAGYIPARKAVNVKPIEAVTAK
ncbi:MAG: ABC transporter permease [Candidatus Aphodosoma sp.]